MFLTTRLNIIECINPCPFEFGTDVYVEIEQIIFKYPSETCRTCSHIQNSNSFQTQVRGTDYKTQDGTCIRDYIDVTDLVDAHVKALEKAKPGHVGIYNVGTGKGKPPLNMNALL